MLFRSCSDYDDVYDVDDGRANYYDINHNGSNDDHRSVIWRGRSCSSSGRSSDCFFDIDFNLVNDDNADDVDHTINDDASVRRAGSFARRADTPAI